jgi:hypothetical protein
MQNNKPTNKDNDNKMIGGIDKHFTDPKPMTIGGKQTTPMALKAIFQADIDATNEVDGARMAWLAAVAKARDARALAAQTRSAVKAYLVGLYGPEAAGVIGDFGFPASKAPGQKSVKTKAVAIERSAATRKARHTMGSQQRKAVKGTVTVISPAAGEGPVPSPAAAAAPAPAPSASTSSTTTSSAKPS